MNTYTQTVLRGLMAGMVMVSIASAHELSGEATGFPTNGAGFDLFNWDGGVSGVLAEIT
ncbi:hypothetical protein [Pontiella agarivorans]|uniref:Uncharacterized protein n=1 Tax=Pontiella agarivorans TaxID=3038953 RepID=A0ABU5N0J3_9BACT|nr:hypothetical protein [Pontiella agarivorans]MDZ8119955.1 hypothetical protein [Pontiella agarivorans]